MAEIDRFLLSHEMEVILVVLGRRAFELSEKLVGDIEEYIDEHGIAQLHEAEYGIWYGSERWGRPEQNKSSVMLGAPLFPDVTGMSLDEILERCWSVGVAVQDGRPFHGANAIRINLALPKARVEEAFRRMEQYAFI